MQYTDVSPPRSPTLNQQRDALRKGLGRAMPWARAGRLDDEPLLTACLNDLRFDTQTEESRGYWLWGLIRAAGAADRFRVPILHALYGLANQRDANQLCELACHYAQNGDEAFRPRLLEIVDQTPFADQPWLAESEVVQLDGEEGFLFAARVRGRRLMSRDWEWDDSALVKDAAERFGEGRLAELLEQTGDKAIQRFFNGWREHQKPEAETGPSEPERTRSAAVDEIIAAAGSANADSWLFRRWGRHADLADLDVVLRNLLAPGQDTKVISDLLEVFSSRAYPRFDDRLIQLCRHDDPDVRRRAYNALRRTTHPAVREFALDEIERGAGHETAVGLLIRNYEPGDEHRVVEVVELPEDDVELHWLLMDVIKLLEENPDADPSRLALIAYASTPCGKCRADAARLLHARRVVPNWLTEECRFDSCGRCRELVEKTLGW